MKIALAAPLLLAGALHAQPLPPPMDEPTDQHVSVRLVSEHTALVPGKTAMLGLVFEIAPDWHIYWNGRNDSGVAPRATFTLPDGYVVGEWQWPAPKRHVAPGDILDHVYEDRVTILVPVTVPADASPASTVKLSAKVNWLVCSTVCVPEGDSVSVSLPVAEPSSTPSKSPEAPLFDTARARLPKPLAKDSPIKVGTSATEATIDVPGAKSLAFMPLRQCVDLSDLVRDGDTKGEHLKLGFGRKAKSPKRLLGVLEVRTSDKKPSYYLIDSHPPVQPAEEASAEPKPEGAKDQGESRK